MTFVFVTMLAGVIAGGSARADEPTPLRYTTSWVGNSFGGGPEWVQNAAESLQVLADGTLVVGSFWDEAGHEVGLYKGGRVVGALADTHMRGGFAVAATDKYLFYAHTCARRPAAGQGGGGSSRQADL